MSISLGVQGSEVRLSQILAKLKMKAYHQSGKHLIKLSTLAIVTLVLASYIALVFKGFKHLANLSAFELLTVIHLRTNK